MASIEAQMRRCVLPLMAVTGEARWVGIGTAFVVGVVDDGRTALLFTAAHNLIHAAELDPYIGRATHHSAVDEFTISRTPTLGSTKLYVLTANCTPARMDRAWWRGDSDVAFLSVTLPADSPDRFDMRLPVDTRPAVPADFALTAVGFRELATEFTEPPDYDAERFVVSVRTLLDGRNGVVLRGISGNDPGNHNGLGLIVTCAIDSGMSGGPIVEHRSGRIVARAIASRSLSTSDRAASGSDHSFVSLLLPGLAIRADGLVAATADETIEAPTVLDLIRASVIEDLGRADEWVRLV